MKISFQFPHTLSSDRTREYRRRVLMLLCALIIVLPLAWRGVSCGHDFDFHLQSWLEVEHAWMHGVFYPHWIASANYGAGEPRLVFYPPVTWILGALLGTVLPWTWVPLLFTLSALVACVFAFYNMASEWMTLDAAAVAACLYVVNPYLLFVAYERAAYGELISAAWLPLLLLFALRKRSSPVPLALVVAALWLTNAPSAVMGCYFLAVMALVAAIGEKNAALLGRAAGGVALGLGLAAFYVLPAQYEEHWIEIARAIGPGMRIQDSFLFGHTGEPFHDQVLRTASWIAIALLAAAFTGALLSKERRRGVWLPMTLVSTLIAFLLLPWSDAAWGLLPELRYLQFPWRWLLVLALAAATLIGMALRGQFRETATRGAIRTRALTVLTFAVLMTLSAARSFWQFCDDEDNVRAQMRTLHAEGFEGSDEYTPAGDDNGEVEQGMPLVRVLRTPDGEEPDSSAAMNPKWKPDAASETSAKVQFTHSGVERIKFTVSTAAPGFAVLRLMEYPAWRVKVNGVPVSGRPHREDGLMVVPVGAGVSRISVNYGATEDVWAGRGISALSLLVLAVLKRKRIG